MAEMVLKVKHTEGKETKIGVEMRANSSFPSMNTYF